MRRMLEILLVVLLLAVSPITYADVDDLVGDWQLETTGFAFNGATSQVHLTIEKSAEGVEAYIYDGPVPIRLDGDAFEIDMDWATAFDTVHLSTFRGQLNEDGTISGQPGSLVSTDRLWASFSERSFFQGAPSNGSEAIRGEPPLQCDRRPASRPFRRAWHGRDRQPHQ